MKRFLAFVVFVIALVWGCNRCSDKESPKDDVLKEVTVSAKVANLRSGPGTNYAVISANADGSGGKYQVRRGTKLDVLSESGGWFKIRVPREERTAYIKQTLCNDPSAKSKSRNSGSRKGRGASSDNPSASSTTASEATTPEANPAPPVAPAEEEVVEMTSGRGSQDEVFY
jgi:uncharacterized protein YgiM (DUF1202 family)